MQSSNDIEAIAEGYRQKIDELTKQRGQIDDLLREYRRRLDACEILALPEPSLEELPEKPSESASEPRFGRELYSFTEQLLAKNGTMTIEGIYAALPGSLRDSIERSGSKENALFRVRRAFRRNKDFRVDRSSGLVEFLGSGSALPLVSKIYTSLKGEPLAVDIQDRGSTRKLTISDFASAIDEGRRYGVQGQGRVSMLLRDRQGGFLRSYFGGVPNDDHRYIERVVEEVTR